ncbi:MAG: MBL fold metallo-hydrolase [Oscillospiraceae bacterium]|jgi:glyoxylase-like metal-dependent hydrolase (beta-lactamase superfamily II)|nr:MBL fold metallo-hydrolase [Oscillospiraceae bacterium]
MLIQPLEVGPVLTNCYIVGDETTMQCAVIDPGAESAAILNYIEDAKFSLTAILITHGHFDHITAVPEIIASRAVPVFVHPADSQPLEGTPNLRTYRDGDRVSVGALTFEVIATPGHTPGGVCLRCEDALFTGDTLFRDSCGRTDFDGGSMEVLLDSLRRLSALPGDYEVYPGHAESSTLERERMHNYYVKYALNRA